MANTKSYTIYRLTVFDTTADVDHPEWPLNVISMFLVHYLFFYNYS